MDYSDSIDDITMMRAYNFIVPPRLQGLYNNPNFKGQALILYDMMLDDSSQGGNVKCFLPPTIGDLESLIHEIYTDAIVSVDMNLERDIMIVFIVSSPRDCNSRIMINKIPRSMFDDLEKLSNNFLGMSPETEEPNEWFSDDRLRAIYHSIYNRINTLIEDLLKKKDKDQRLFVLYSSHGRTIHTNLWTITEFESLFCDRFLVDYATQEMIYDADPDKPVFIYRNYVRQYMTIIE
jgi:hypothetical protein